MCLIVTVSFFQWQKFVTAFLVHILITIVAFVYITTFSSNLEIVKKLRKAQITTLKC